MALIGCSEAVRNLWEFLDRGLDEGDHAAVEQHLAYCKRCCGELEFARQLRGLLQDATTSDLPRDVQARLEDVIDGLDDAEGATP